MFTRQFTAPFITRFFILTPTHVLISSILVLPSGCATLYALCSTIASAAAANTCCLNYENTFFAINAYLSENTCQKVIAMATKAWLNHAFTWKFLLYKVYLVVIIYLYIKIFSNCWDDNKLVNVCIQSLKYLFLSFLSLRGGYWLPDDTLLLFGTELNLTLTPMFRKNVLPPSPGLRNYVQFRLYLNVITSSWRSRQHITPKHPHQPTILHGVKNPEP